MKRNAGSDGTGFVGLLTIVFITLKLCGVIHWSWVWVLDPIWIPIALVVLIVAIVVICAAICAATQEGLWK